MYGIADCQNVDTGRFILFNKTYATKKKNNEKCLKRLRASTRPIFYLAGNLKSKNSSIIQCG